MKEIEVWIDNNKVALNSVFPFYQRDPFPGDHRYELQIVFNNEALIRKVVSRYSLDEPEQINWNSFLSFYLTAVWPDLGEGERASYLINSVEEIIINPLSISLKGISSTII